jgi:hypothetical protein
MTEIKIIYADFTTEIIENIDDTTRVCNGFLIIDTKNRMNNKGVNHWINTNIIREFTIIKE